MRLDTGMRQAIIKLLVKGDMTREEIMLELGIGRGKFDHYMPELIASKEVYRRGRGRGSYYSIDPYREKKTPVQAESKIPELPPIMLNWLGYNDKTPTGGRMIWGV